MNTFELLTSLIAVAGLILGVRSELRALYEKKQKKLQNSAVTYAALYKIINLSYELKFTEPNKDICSQVIKEKSKLDLLLKECNDALMELKNVSPENIISIIDLTEAIENLCNINCQQDDNKSYIKLIVTMHDFYRSLRLLSITNVNRELITNNQITYQDIMTNKFINEFDKRYEKFRIERYKFIGQVNL